MSKQSKRDRQRENREARRQYLESLERRRRTWKTVRTLAIIVVPVIAVGAFFSLKSEDEKPTAAERAGCREVKKQPAPKDTTFEEAGIAIDSTKTYDALVQTSCGSFTIRLATAEAPITTNSFAFLASEGFYDGQIFHRVAKDFVIQGGDPLGTGTGGPGYELADEPPTAGYQNGSVAMANSGPGTTGSQFFIVTSDEGAANLGGPPYLYSALGQVTEGLETLRRINRLGSIEPDPANQQPKAIILIQKITVTEVTAAP